MKQEKKVRVSITFLLLTKDAWGKKRQVHVTVLSEKCQELQQQRQKTKQTNKKDKERDTQSDKKRDKTGVGDCRREVLQFLTNQSYQNRLRFLKLNIKCLRE